MLFRFLFIVWLGGLPSFVLRAEQSGQSVLPELVVVDQSEGEASAYPSAGGLGVESDEGPMGTVEEDFAARAPISVVLPAAAGELSSIRGTGRRSEDTDVSTLGIPLNPRYGGGVNLSTLPPFLWRGWSYSEGFGSDTLDPRGLGDSLDLSLWSAARAKRSSLDIGMGLRLADDPTATLWAGYRSKGSVPNRLGLRAGMGSGIDLNRKGGVSDPFQAAGSLSVQRKFSERLTSEVHAIVSHLQVRPRGTLNFPTPEARQVDDRDLVVLRSKWKGDRVEVRSSQWLDFLLNRYEDPAFGSSANRSWWAGSRLDVLTESGWESGVQADYLNYSSPLIGRAADKPAEQGFLVGRVGYLWSGALGAQRVRLEPTLRSDGLFRPDAEWLLHLNESWTVTAGVRHQFPSLLDAEAEGYFSVPNPDLQPEQSWQAGVAYERKLSRRVRTRFFARGDFRRSIFQYRVDPSFRSQAVNDGDAWMLHVGNKWTIDFPLGIVLEPQWRLSPGRLLSGEVVQGLPLFSGGARVAWEGKNFSVFWSNWFVSSRESGGVETLDAYVLGALGLEGRLEHWRLRTQVTNLYAQAIQFTYDQIPLGLQWSLSVSRSLDV